MMLKHANCKMTKEEIELKVKEHLNDSAIKEYLDNPKFDKEDLALKLESLTNAIDNIINGYPHSVIITQCIDYYVLRTYLEKVYKNIKHVGLALMGIIIIPLKILIEIHPLGDMYQDYSDCTLIGGNYTIIKRLDKFDLEWISLYRSEKDIQECINWVIENNVKTC